MQCNIICFKTEPYYFLKNGKKQGAVKKVRQNRRGGCQPPVQWENKKYCKNVGRIRKNAANPPNIDYNLFAFLAGQILSAPAMKIRAQIFREMPQADRAALA